MRFWSDRAERMRDRPRFVVPLATSLLRLGKDTLKQTLTGIVEVDESFVLESRKRELGLPKSLGFRTNRRRLHSAIHSNFSSVSSERYLEKYDTRASLLQG